jgi:hypothetical protein
MVSVVPVFFASWLLLATFWSAEGRITTRLRPFGLFLAATLITTF